LRSFVLLLIISRDLQHVRLRAALTSLAFGIAAIFLKKILRENVMTVVAHPPALARLFIVAAVEVDSPSCGVTLPSSMAITPDERLRQLT
jgi:hypothetical protein